MTVDPTGKLVKPNITVQRSTIILRDIAADVPEEVRFPWTRHDTTPL